MTGEIVNLRKARKAKRRADHEVKAVVQRARHGRTRADRAMQTLETTRARRLLDGAQLRPRGDPGDGG